MNFERIRPSVAVNTMQARHVTMVGGAYQFTSDLVRCGLRAVTIVDFDVVKSHNPARQDLDTTDLGRHKAEATAAHLQRINPELEVNVVLRDYCTIPREEHDELFGHTDLFAFAADAFPPAARGNIEALRLGKPALYIGLYQGGRAGEIIFHNPGGTPACYRCICGSRYEAFRSGYRGVTSDGGTILDLHLVDAIAGQVAVGLLTQGAPNRFGRLIEQLGNRNLLQVKLDPEYRLGEKDIFGQYLGSHASNFSFTTIALPMDREEDCPDCRHLHEEVMA